MRKSWQALEGAPFPLGATWLAEEQAFNFSLYSKHATAVSLLLFNDGELDRPALRRQLNYLVNKSGRAWHCRLSAEELGDATYYAYQIEGPEHGVGFDLHAFDAEKLLLDPYAKQVFFPREFDRQAAMKPGSNMGRAPLGVLTRNGHGFDWEDDKVPRHEHDLIIYELHVRGFTQSPSSQVPHDRRGTFLGVVDKIPYLKELGITAVELMPIFQYDPQEGNFWGYMPLNFFAPHSQYATEPHHAAHELRTMIKALHAAGIEVLLDVVFNHTAEGNSNGPCYSYKGIDNSTYYIISADTDKVYANYTGTGNTLHTKNRQVSRIILDSMRSWISEYHADGFRFDLASVFNRHGDGSVSTDESGLVASIRADPWLGNVRLIAEPWDAAGLHQLGTAFPGKRWRQWNSYFRDDVRRAVRGDAGLVSGLMRRLYGSDDLFPDTLMDACHPFQSINYVCSHDGFTLYDQVSYNERHNWTNGEENRDGHQENYSWNCGWEGDEEVPDEVLWLRLQQVKNFCCLLMLANGTPMFRAGDEFLHTQKGNNNPYNQDNELTWLDWNRLETYRDHHRFFRQMIAFRKAHPSIARSRYWREDVRWYGTGPTVDWSESSRHFAYSLAGQSQQDIDLYVMINLESQARTFTIQEYQDDRWRLVVDTSQASPNDIYEAGDEPLVREQEFQLRPRSIVVLRSN
ncbi:glycogen debranching protein [Planctomycetaceae bacterium SH139]